MNKIYGAAAAAVIALAAAGPSLAAGPQATVQVLGTLEVPGCEVTQDDSSNVYDFGSLESSLIKPGTATNTLTDRAIEKTWTIRCDGLTYLTYKVTDHEAGNSSPATATQFGLGKVNGDKNIGYYEVLMSGATVDAGNVTDIPARVFATTGTGISGQTSVSLDRGRTMGWSKDDFNELIAAETFRAKFKVTPTLNGTQTMGGPITENIVLDGALTLDFAFGL